MIKKESTLKLETEYFSNHTELNSTVFLAYSSSEDKNYTNPIDEFIQNIQMHNYKGLKLVTQIFEDQIHLLMYPTALPNGLKTIFKP